MNEMQKIDAEISLFEQLKLHHLVEQNNFSPYQKERKKKINFI